jgi:putative membrane protein
MSPFFAFLHHLAAFTLVGALVAELILIRDNLTLKNARMIQLADMTFGVSAGVLLIIGLLRVSYFEKGASYYLHNVPFVAKMSLFVLVGLLSVYPTVEFLSWRKSVKQGQGPAVTDRKLCAIRSIIQWELIGVVLIVLCAALMAKGIGYLV